MSAAFLATDLSVDMQSFTCLCAFMKRQHRNQHWHMRLFLALGKSCLHLFTCVFHYAAKVVLARLRQVWSGLPEDPWCKTRRSKALEKNVFAVFFTGVRKPFVKMPLCWLQSDPRSIRTTFGHQSWELPNHKWMLRWRVYKDTYMEHPITSTQCFPNLTLVELETIYPLEWAYLSPWTSLSIT